MKEFEIEVSKTVHDNFIAENENEAIDKAMQRFENESIEIYTLDETDLGEDKSYQPAVNEFNEDSLSKLTDEELDSLKATIEMIKCARAKQARRDAIQAFNEAAKRLFDLNLTVTAFDLYGDSIEVYDLKGFEIDYE